MIAFTQRDDGIEILGEANSIEEAKERYGEPHSGDCLCVAVELPDLRKRKVIVNPTTPEEKMERLQAITRAHAVSLKGLKKAYRNGLVETPTGEDLKRVDD